jgi:hypothetical protein
MSQGMRIFSRRNIKAGDQNSTTQLMFLIILSTIIQILLFPAYVWLVKTLWQIDVFNKILHIEVALNDTKTIPNDISFSLQDWVAISSYALFAYIFSFGLGAIFIWAIERGFVPIPTFHGSMYRLIKGKFQPKLFCSVVTKINHENSFLMYRGELEEISYVSHNKIDYIALSDVSRYLLKISPSTDKPLLTSVLASTSIGKDIVVTDITTESKVTYFDDPDNVQKNKNRELLFINGDEIANILISKYLKIKRKEINSRREMLKYTLFFFFGSLISIDFLSEGFINTSSEIDWLPLFSGTILLFILMGVDFVTIPKTSVAGSNPTVTSVSGENI